MDLTVQINYVAYTVKELDLSYFLWPCKCKTYNMEIKLCYSFNSPSQIIVATSTLLYN